ncbi:hypothetical protein PMYN1_Chma86 (chromatophore) [Paulinella micropora]|uniref:DUF3086 domain-containing protein n=1 Tax=Paulinella micropora TaxID=1928728 RepID=A0A1S6YH99_9EUKA|nr:hypothetical protein PFK_124 [Paulinella micropora]BBL85898.1 hypothetical protein PMYN1_Chma86 [Paulinella micropora]
MDKISEHLPEKLHNNHNRKRDHAENKVAQSELILKEEKIDNNKVTNDIFVTSSSLFKLALNELQERRDQLQSEIKELEERRERIHNEITKNSLTQSDAIARKLKGFQTYLTGALQDLAASAEHIELGAQTLKIQPSSLDQNIQLRMPTQTAAGAFAAEENFLRQQLRKLVNEPIMQNDAWKLHRHLDQSSLLLVEDWFFNQGGRGAQESYGSRSQDILAAAAIVSTLGELYGDRFQTLVLAGRPEHLGEWRRGLQDCLGLTRKDFGPNNGIMLFERVDSLIERADRLEQQRELPFIIVDVAEKRINTSILKFPFMLVFTNRNSEFFEEDELL